MVYDNLLEIADNFEVFLFDAYGVFWGGNGFFPNSKEIMQKLMVAGKTVAVVSNATLMHEDMVASYQRKDLLEGRDYTFMVSSGEVLRRDLLNKKLKFAGCRKPRKVYNIGAKNEKMFAGTIYQSVETPEEADFVYCGVPFLTAAEAAEYSRYAADFLPVKADESGKIVLWDSVIEKPFEKIVDRAAALGLPALNANPDYVAQEGHPLAKDKSSHFVVRNGTLAKMLRERGLEVLEYGKPHANIYEYVFEKLTNQGKMCAKSKICMIGDTVRTDVKGAINSGIVPVLCVKTGVTSLELSKGNTVKNLCESENIDVQQVIEINSVGGM